MVGCGQPARGRPIGNVYYIGPPSDHFDGVRFHNAAGGPDTDKGWRDLWRWKRTGQRGAWPAMPVGTPGTPPQRVDGIRATLVGHATVLLQIDGRNLLIDPIWSDRASPIRWFGPRRHDPPGIAFDDLPPIDAVLITHNHYDHMDIPTIRRLWQAHRPLLLCPLGNDAILRRAVSDPDRVQAADWGACHRVDETLRVTLVPAHHWSARGLRDRRHALWCGFVVQAGFGTVYVAGDTAYGDGRIFRDIGARFGAPDLAILPIGAYAPRWFMASQHVDSAEAVQIMIDCKAVAAIGTHWGCFRLTDEPRCEPAQKVQEALARHGLPPERFRAMRPGDSWVSHQLERHHPDGEPAGLI